MQNMESKPMKKFMILLCAAFLVSACYKPYSTSIDLGVNNTRIDIPWSDAQATFNFTFPVYSAGAWSAEIVAGGDWLSLSDNSGTGTGYIKCTSRPNTAGVPRAVKMLVSGSGKEIPVYIVVSSQEVSAADLEDAELNQYLI